MGRSPCCDENGLKKGPWTPEEDQKLVQHIQKHGHGSWRALPKLAGCYYINIYICSFISMLISSIICIFISLAIFLQVLTDVEKVVG